MKRFAFMLVLVACASPPPPSPATSPTPSASATPAVATAEPADAGAPEAAAPAPAVATGPVTYPTAPDDTDALILRREACNGTCPIYSVGGTSARLSSRRLVKTRSS